MSTFERVSDESTGLCPCGCGSLAFPYAVEGADGYVDACPEHAEECLIDAGFLPPISPPCAS